MAGQKIIGHVPMSVRSYKKTLSDADLRWEPIIADELFVIYATAFGTETEIGANLAQIHLLSWHEILSGNIKKAAENQMILINSIPYFKIREQFVAEIDQWLKDLLIEKMNRLETDVVEKTLNRHECIEDAAEFIHPSTIAA